MAKRVDIRAELAIGRSAWDVGRVPEMAEWICDLPRRVPRLIELLWDDDPGVANRAADVMERIMRQPSPALRRAVCEYKDALMGLLADSEQPRVLWNLAVVIPRVELTLAECRRVACVLQGWLDDRSSIIKTAALHGMAQLTRQDPDSLPAVLDMLRIAGRSGTAAMRARSRHLLKELEKPVAARRAHTGMHMFG